MKDEMEEEITNLRMQLGGEEERLEWRNNHMSTMLWLIKIRKLNP